MGDTGLMHLAAASRRFPSNEDEGYLPCNARNTVVLFGGTNADLYGYPERTIIVGRGWKEQLRLRPGFSKEAYHPGTHNLFDHIRPEQVVDAVMKVLSL